MPDILWAKELGLDLKTLERERPDDISQRQLAMLQNQRGEAFAEFSRFHNTEDLYGDQIIAFELYSSLTRILCDLIGSPIPDGIIIRERRKITEEAILKNTCTRCGFVWTLRQPRFVGGLCSSCLALQEKVLRRGRLACQPWQGRFGPDDLTPVNAAGTPVLPGHRVCNNRDCVNPKHIRKGRKQNG